MATHPARSTRLDRLSRADEHGRPIDARPAQKLALRVLQAGCVAVVLVAATYKLFELDRFFIPKELTLNLVALLAAVLCLGAARRAQVSRVDLLLGGFLLLSAASAALAQNPWNGVRALAVSASGIVVFWCARAVGRAGLARPLLAAIAAAVVLGAATSLAQTYGVRVDFFSLNRAPGGTLGNRNFVAHLCAFGLPVLFLCALRAYRGLGTLLGALGVAAVTGTLVLTRSRAAWLGVVAVLLVFLVGWLLVPTARRSVRHWMRLLLLLASAAGGVAAVIVLPNTLHWNSDNPYADTAAGLVNAKEGSGRGRLLQWKNTAEMAASHPLLGVGPGNWPVVYPRYARASDPSMSDAAGVTSNPWPSSDWVAFVAERGIAAAAMLLLAFAGLGIAALHRMRAARDADEGLAALALAAMVAGALVVGAFDAVLLLGLPSMLIWAALGVLSADEPGRWEVPVPVPLRGLGMLLVVAVFGAFTLKSAGQLAAMSVYEGSAGRASRLEQAASLDPGSYRIQLRLARSSAPCAVRREAAERAHALYPQAGAAKNLHPCGGRRRRR